MKFSINKKILASVLQLLIKAAPTRSTLSIINSGLFTVENDLLYARSTDLEISLNIKTKIENGENGSIAIPLSKLLEITNAMPEGNIEINVTDIGKVNIISNVGKYTIMGQSSDEFPAKQKIIDSKELAISGKSLKYIILNTSYATSKDDLKPVLQGVLFQIIKDSITAVSTDGHRLVKVEKKNKRESSFIGNVVIPSKFLNLINTLIDEQKDIIIHVADNHVHIEKEGVELTSRIIKDPYPDYSSVIPKENNKTLICNNKEFSKAIQRIAIFSNKTSRQISLEISENQINITTEDAESVTSGKETIGCNYDGDPMVIGYNANYLKEVLQHQSSEEVKIKLNTPLNAGLFMPLEEEEESKKITLLMPIRLSE